MSKLVLPKPKHISSKWDTTTTTTTNTITSKNKTSTVQPFLKKQIPAYGHRTGFIPRSLEVFLDTTLLLSYYFYEFFFKKYDRTLERVELILNFI
jgi:hypothetical protein